MKEHDFDFNSVRAHTVFGMNKPYVSLNSISYVIIKINLTKLKYKKMYLKHLQPHLFASQWNHA